MATSKKYLVVNTANGRYEIENTYAAADLFAKDDYISGSTGVSDANKPVKTNALGDVDESFLPSIVVRTDADSTLANGVTISVNSDTTFTDLDLVSKSYVDAIAQGLAVHAPVRFVQAAELTATYSNGTSGVGATLTNSGTQAALQVESLFVDVNDRILYKGDTSVGVQEAFTVTCQADSGGSLNNKYFWIFNMNGDNLVSFMEYASYYFWFNVNGAGTDPNPTLPVGAPSTKYGIEVILATNASAGDVATAIGDAIDSICGVTHGFSGIPTINGADLELVNGDNEPLNVKDAMDGNTGFTILVTQQGSASYYKNGIYIVTNVGSASTNWVLTRAEDFDNQPTSEVHDGDYFFVGEGGVYQHTGWVQTQPWKSWSIVGNWPITFMQFSAAGLMTATNGLSASGTNWKLDLNTLTIARSAAIVDSDTTAYKDASDSNTTKYTSFTNIISDLNIQTAIPSGTTGNFVSIDANDDIADSGYSSSSFASAGHDHSGVYAPISHSHTTGDITGLQEYIEDTVGVEFTTVEGDIDFTYSDSSGVVSGAIKSIAVKDTMIDFGTGAGQVNATDMPITDSANVFDATNVETALKELYDGIGSVTYTTDGTGVTKGDVVYLSADNVVSKWSTITSNQYIVGIAAETKGASVAVRVVWSGELVTGILTTATAGNEYYWTGSAWSATYPATADAFVYQVGIAKNATDAVVQIQFIAQN